MRPTGFQVEEQVYASDPDFIKAPSESDMMKGVKPLDTLPAAWWNWLWNQATKQDNNIFLDVNDLRQEILSVLNAAGITPSASATNQLLQSIVRINQTIATATVPGSVISSSDIRSVSVDPVTGQMLVNALSDWASEDTIKKALDALRTAVEQEVTDRKAAITAEAKARTDADTTLQGNIDTLTGKLSAEISEREVADTTLQANISTLSGKLSAEISEREVADTTLQANIDKKNDKITTTTDYDVSLTDDNTWATPTIIGTNPTKFFVRKLSQLWSYISNKIGFPLAISKGGTGGTSESTAVNNLLVRKAVDAETDLKNLPVATGCYPVTHTGFSGSAFVFYASGSRSNLGFLLRGGSGTTAPEVLSALDSSPSKWTNHGRMITSLTISAEVAAASPTIGHQAVFGRNLLTVLGVADIKAAAAKLKTNAGRGLVQPGDFLTITLSGIGSYRWEVAGVNHYRIFASGNSLSYDIGNVVFICSSLLPARRISPTGRRQYFGSEMDTYLKDIIAPLLEGALGTTLLTPLLMQSYNDDAYNSPSWYWDPDDEIGDDAYPWSLAARKCFLPSIIELVGGEQFGSAYSNVGYGNARQFALMSMVPDKVDVTTDSLVAAWTRTPSRHPGDFYRLSHQGNTHSDNAHATYGVRPVFCL